MTDLVARLREAIDETEQIAREAWQENWRWYAEDKTVMTHANQRGEWDGYRTTGTRADAEHIARHDPASVLRRCAADRKLLDMWQLSPERELQAHIGDWSSCSDSCPPTIGEYVLATLAEAYGVEEAQ